jgi:hypothetical protein
MADRDFLDSARYAQEAYPRIPYQKPEHDVLMEYLNKPLFDWDEFVESNYRQLMKRIENEIIGGLNMEKKFAKKDLRSGYVVEFRNGTRRLVARAGGFTQILVNPVSGEWNYLVSRWRDDLTCNDDTYATLCANECACPQVNPRDYDIVKVWGLNTKTAGYKYTLTADTECRDLLWERKAAKKMTVDEVSKLLGYEVEIVGNGR